MRSLSRCATGVAILAGFVSLGLALPTGTTGTIQQASLHNPEPLENSELDYNSLYSLDATSDLDIESGQTTLYKRGAKLVPRAQPGEPDYMVFAIVTWNKLIKCTERKTAEAGIRNPQPGVSPGTDAMMRRIAQDCIQEAGLTPEEAGQLAEFIQNMPPNVVESLGRATVWTNQDIRREGTQPGENGGDDDGPLSKPFSPFILKALADGPKRPNRGITWKSFRDQLKVPNFFPQTQQRQPGVSHSVPKLKPVF